MRGCRITAEIRIRLLRKCQRKSDKFSHKPREIGNGIQVTPGAGNSETTTSGISGENSRMCSIAVGIRSSEPDAKRTLTVSLKSVFAGEPQTRCFCDQTHAGDLPGN